MTSSAIDLDALDETEIEQLRPDEKKRPRYEKSKAEIEEAEEIARQQEEYERRINERLRKLRDRSLSPPTKRKRSSESPTPRDGRRRSRSPDRGYDDKDRPRDRDRRERDRREREPDDPKEIERRLIRSKEDEEAAKRIKDAGRPLTKIELQLEKARKNKEKAKRERQDDTALLKRINRGNPRLREFKIMAQTDKHWTEKDLNEMSERDWRILKEDFEMQIMGGGGGCPNPMRNWEEGYRLGYMADKLMEAIDEAGYKDPSPIQMACIPIGYRRLDVIGTAETGSGKTCAFVIPMVMYITEQPPHADRKEDGPYAVIMCPTRELARQIEDECYRFCKPFGYHTVSVVGGTRYEDQGQEIRRGAEVLIGTPGRLCDLIERHYLVLNQCNYVILDEADRMVEDGMESQIIEVFHHMPASNTKPSDPDDEEAGKVYRVTMMFSATMPVELERIAKKHLRRPVIIKIGLSSPSDIKQIVEVLTAQEKKPRLIQLVQQCLLENGMIIVFANQRNDVDMVAMWLDEEKIRAEAIHGGKSQAERERLLNDFHEKKFQVMVATDLLGRGIDVKGVTHVINYDMPVGDKAIDKYTHRIGRTGRAGMKGTAFSFLMLTDTDIMYDLKKKLESAGAPIPRDLAQAEAAKIPPGSVAKKRKDQVLYKY